MHELELQTNRVQSPPSTQWHTHQPKLVIVIVYWQPITSTSTWKNFRNWLRVTSYHETNGTSGCLKISLEQRMRFTHDYHPAMRTTLSVSKWCCLNGTSSYHTCTGRKFRSARRAASESQCQFLTRIWVRNWHSAFHGGI